MTNVTVTRELEPTQGRYVGRITGSDAEAELTFQRPNPRLFVADHTLTPVALRGRGIARSDTLAYAWLKKAADQGHVEAQKEVAKRKP